MKATLPRLPLLVAIGMLLPAAALLRGADWPDWRGPARTGVSTETGLASSWSPAGENLAWKVPYGGRSGPVVFGDRLYLQNTSGAGEGMQERLMCFHADTGKLLWEHQLQPLHERRAAAPHRVGVAGRRSRDRQRLRLQRQRPADVAVAATASCSGNARSPKSSACGRRTAGAMSSPIIDGDQLIVSGLMFSWGQHAGGAHRFISFDKMNGQMPTGSARPRAGRPTPSTPTRTSPT